MCLCFMVLFLCFLVVWVFLRVVGLLVFMLISFGGCCVILVSLNRQMSMPKHACAWISISSD